MFLGQQQRAATVGQHPLQTLKGQIRVQGQVRATGLDHPQQCHHQFHGALGTHRYRYIRANALSLKPMGQLIGPGLQLAIAQLRIAIHQRQGIGGGTHLFGDQGWQARVLRIVFAGGIPACQLLLLRRCQRLQFMQRALRLLQQLLEQVQKMRVPGVHGGRFEQVGGVTEGGRNLTLRVFLGGQGQVQLSGFGSLLQALEHQPARLQLAVAALQVVVQHLEQRVAAKAALGLQRFDQLFERQVLMGLGLQRLLTHSLELIDKGLAARDLQRPDLSVDEATNQTLGRLRLTIGHRDPDPQLPLAAQAAEPHTVGGQQNHERRGLLLPGELAQAAAGGIGQGLADPRPTVAGQAGTQVVHRQLQHRFLTSQAFAPIGQLLLALAGLQPQPLPARIVAVLHIEVGQRAGVAPQVTGITAGHFLDKQLHRHTVGNDVMQGHQQGVTLLGATHQTQAQQRPQGQVEGLPRLILGQAHQGCVPGPGRQFAEVFASEYQPALSGAMYPHPGLAALFGKVAAQYCVAGDDIGQGSVQRRLVEFPGELQPAGNVISA